MITHDKNTLRRYMRERLRAMDESARHMAGRQMTEHLLGSGPPGAAAHVLQCPRNEDDAPAIALFGGLRNEPDLLPALLPALAALGFTACLFQIEHDLLQPRAVGSLEDLQRGVMNVWEPKPHCLSIPVASLEVILVPGLAFTRDGFRLGRGGGYYDRLLAHPHCRALRIGIAYDLQIIDDIPVEPHDQRVHQIITETGLIDASSNG